MLQADGKAGVLVARRNLVALFVLFALPPLSTVVLALIGYRHAHVIPVGLSVLDEDVREDYLDGRVENLPDYWVVLWINALDYAEDALLDVCTAGDAVDRDDEGEIVADDVLPWYHSGGRLATHARICTGEVGLPAVGAVDAHQEHVLAEPPFPDSLLNCEPERGLLQTDGVAAVLGVD